MQAYEIAPGWLLRPHAQHGKGHRKKSDKGAGTHSNGPYYLNSTGSRAHRTWGQQSAQAREDTQPDGPDDIVSVDLENVS